MHRDGKTLYFNEKERNYFELNSFLYCNENYFNVALNYKRNMHICGWYLNALCGLGHLRSISVKVFTGCVFTACVCVYIHIYKQTITFPRKSKQRASKSRFLYIV